MYLIENCVIPAAGLGTRMLPATRVIPKELLPIVNVPAIDYLLEEILRAGVKNIIFVISNKKLLIRDYVNAYFAGNLSTADKSFPSINYEYVFQNEPLGLAHAILQSAQNISSKAFAVALPDDIIQNGHRCLQLMMRSYNETGASIIAVQKVDKRDLHKYGVVQFAGSPPADAPRVAQNTANRTQAADPRTKAPRAVHPTEPCGKLIPIRGIVEKPTPQEAPSSYACIGRYVFSVDIFSELESLINQQQNSVQIGEIGITDAVDAMIRKGHKVNAFVCNHVRCDIGNREDFLKTLLHFASPHNQPIHQNITPKGLQ